MQSPVFIDTRARRRFQCLRQHRAQGGVQGHGFDLNKHRADRHHTRRRVNQKNRLQYGSVIRGKEIAVLHAGDVPRRVSDCIQLPVAGEVKRKRITAKANGQRR